MFTRNDLDALTAIQPPPAVSIFMPVHSIGRETRQGPIRLKNLLDQAAARLNALGLRPSETEAMLQPARALAADSQFWSGQNRGLAVFLADGFFRYFQVPIDLNEGVIVGPSFQVRLLLPLLAANGDFLVLAITAGSVHVYQGTRFGLSEMAIDMPRTVADIASETDYQSTRHASPVARPHSGISTGAPKPLTFGEDPEELRKAALIEFLRRVAAVLDAEPAARNRPVVLAAQPEIQGHFRAASRLSGLLPQGIEVNPEALEPGELHARAYALVEPLFSEGRRFALAHFHSLFGDHSGKAITRIEDIIKAEQDGRVDSLLLTDSDPLWGRYDERTGKLIAHGTPEPDDHDLIDDAAVRALRQGGQVFLVGRNELPPGAIMAAVLRY